MRQGQVVGRYATGDVTEAQVAHLISHGSLDDFVADGAEVPAGRRLIGSTSTPISPRTGNPDSTEWSTP
jgi:simple sugar transport system ATP-binding protein